MGTLADKIVPCGRELEHPQRVAGGRGVENDAVIFLLHFLISDEAGKFIERRDFDRARAG